MKQFILMVVSLLYSISAHAFSECYRFDVSSASKGLRNITVSVSGQSRSKLNTASIVAKKSRTRWTSTHFNCSGAAGDISCSQNLGGGDFSLLMKNDVPVLKFVYINLLIGSTGSVAFRPGEEIDEEFALLNVKEAGETSFEDESGEMDAVVLLNGSIIPCASAP